MENSDNNSQEPLRWGLALSGGGFRASFYHLGTIRYLEEAEIMPHVEVMSTVSGGSIIGAYYLVQMEKKLRANPGRDRLEACDEIIKEFSDEVNRNFRMRTLVFHPFYHPVQFLLRLVFKQHGGDTMAKSFERRLYCPALRIGDLPVQIVRGKNNIHGTKLLINTTSLVSGERVVYSRESDTGIVAQIHKSNPNNIPLARAVAASAAVPGLFRPLRIGKEVLSDGGVVENQGIESLLDYFQISEPKINLLPDAFRQHAKLRMQVTEESIYTDPKEQICDRPVGKVFLIVSDGAGQFCEKAIVKASRSKSAMLATSILQAGNRKKVLNSLLTLAKGKDIDWFDGFAFTHVAQNIKGQPEVHDNNRLPSEFIGPTSEIRTDLDSFSEIERDALIYHGYTLMKYRIEKHETKLTGEFRQEKEKGTEADSAQEQCVYQWPPRFIDLCNPKEEHAQRAAIARDYIEKFLAVGKGLLFRDFIRFKWVYGPILGVFILLGTLMSKFALHGHINFSQAANGNPTLYNIMTRYVQKAVLGILPEYSFITKTLGEGGQLWGTVQLLAGLLCVAISFYISLWLYWELKRRFNLPQKLEKNMLEKIESITD